MKKTIVATLSVLSLARRLFTPKSKAELQKVLSKVSPTKPAQPPPQPTLTARQQRRREARAELKRERRRRVLMPQKRKYASLVLKFCLATFGLVASAFGVDSYLASRISVTPGAAIDPANTFGTPFILTNGGYLAAKDVLVDCLYDKIVDTNLNTFSEMSYSGISIDEIRANHPTTVQCRSILSDAPWSEASIRVVVSYRPSFLPWRESETYSFHVKRGTDGTIHWLPH